MNTRERFWARVDKNGPVHPEHGRCWRFISTSSGYGRFSPMRAHRFSWTIHRGPIPKGKSVLHKCDNPNCVNPKHLFLGTQQDNLADMREKGKQVRGEAQGSAVLTAEDIVAIRKRYRRYSHKDGAGAMAKEYGVGIVQVWKIVKGLQWKHIRT
jgi:hypothetical protein